MLARAIARYRTFLRLPDVATMFAIALVTRMPLGTLALSMLMYVRALSDSFATAGATIGAFLAASAATAPFLGRWTDRRGPRGALTATGVVCPLALSVLLFAESLALPNAAIVATAAVAGAFSPPITVLTRTMWRYRFDDDHNRLTAYALDAVLIELAFTLGPALVAVLLALATPRMAFAAAWCFSAASVPLFVLSPALKYWRHQPDARRHLLGPLTEPRLLIVYAATFLFTFCLGLLEVAYAGFATAAAAPALAGVLLAVNSLGSAAGGLVYGALHLNLPGERQVPWFLGVIAVPIALHAVTSSSWVLSALALVAGLLIAPIFTVLAMLVTACAPSRYATEAFTWSATCIVSGVGAGNALAGRLLEGPGAPAAFGLSAAMALAAAVVTASNGTKDREKE
jgi:MFS family permease